MMAVLWVAGAAERRRTTPWSVVVAMLAEGASGILHLHKEGVIHR